MGSAEGVVAISEERKGEVLILKLRGRLDAVSSPTAEKKIFDFINTGQIKLVIDFEEVEYLSSAGMRMLLSTSKKLKSLEGQLVLCEVLPNVLDVLKMSGFDHVLDLAKNQQDALRKFYNVSNH